jgi:hypothetical protein
MLTRSDREARAQLKLTAQSYRKAQARYAARPSPKRAAKVAACHAELAALLETNRRDTPLVA